jgi:AcrR family transcriptional regulator
MPSRTVKTVPTSVAQRRIQDAALRLFAARGVTQLTVSELAEAAGVARGTIYNLDVDVVTLFQSIATRLTQEMTERIDATLASTSDPAQRLAFGMRLFVRRAGEDLVWGRFMSQFGASETSLRALFVGGPARDLERGVKRRRLKLRESQRAMAIAMMAANVLAAITLVLEGHQSWREAGSNAAELFLRALGLPADEARTLSTAELPELVARST